LEAAGGVGIGIDPLYLFACSVLWHKRADAGAGWELVTRLLSELKKKELIRLKGSTLVIRNRTALEAMAA
jgi:hypothetical protein